VTASNFVRPRLLDLFCGPGGAGRGYADAGFEVVGVDIVHQPHYPFEFVRGEALLALQRYGSEFDAIHASPPCQAFTAYRRRPGHVAERPDLITPLRPLLEATGLPYVIENVPGAPLLDPVCLCGSSFGLNVRRHRLFESNVPLLDLPCRHGWQTARYAPATNRRNRRRTVEVGVWRIPLAVQKRAMGVEWDVDEDLSEMVPPAYTHFLGAQIVARLEVAATVSRPLVATDDLVWRMRERPIVRRRWRSELRASGRIESARAVTPLRRRYAAKHGTACGARGRNGRNAARKRNR